MYFHHLPLVESVLPSLLLPHLSLYLLVLSKVQFPDLHFSWVVGLGGVELHVFPCQIGAYSLCVLVAHSYIM